MAYWSPRWFSIWPWVMEWMNTTELRERRKVRTRAVSPGLSGARGVGLLGTASFRLKSTVSCSEGVRSWFRRV